MNKFVTVLAAASAAVFALSSCAGTYQKGDRMPDTTSEQIDTVSYALGMYFGNMVKSNNFGELNIKEIQRAFMDVLNGKESMLTEQEAGTHIQSYAMKRMAYLAERNLEEGEQFMAANKEEEGVVETESGLQYKILMEGTGISPEESDTVEVNYKGRLLDGTEFDSSYERGESAVFPLNRVIKGWTEGLQYAKEGGKIELYIPSELAYGKRGAGPIPGNSTLIFEIELIKVSKALPKDEKETGRTGGRK